MCYVANILNNTSKANQKPSKIGLDQATEIAKLLKQDNFDIKINKKQFGLDALLEDAEIFTKRIGQRATKALDPVAAVETQKVRLDPFPIALVQLADLPPRCRPA